VVVLVDEVHKPLVNQEVLAVEVEQVLPVDQQVLLAKVKQVEQVLQDVTLLVVEVELRKQVLRVQVMHLVQE
jgi:hypothetical protein